MLTKEEMIDHIMPDYLEALIWSSSGDDCEPLDYRYGTDSLTKAALATARSDVERFIELAGMMSIDAAINIEDGHKRSIGHDLWLTQVGHGVGFWDGDWPEPFDTRFTDACKILPDRYVMEAGNNRHLHID